jgi:hypothetical protein
MAPIQLFCPWKRLRKHEDDQRPYALTQRGERIELRQPNRENSLHHRRGSGTGPNSFQASANQIIGSETQTDNEQSPAQKSDKFVGALTISSLNGRLDDHFRRLSGEKESRVGSRLRGEMNSDISSINLKITMATYGGSICDYEKESES